MGVPRRASLNEPLAPAVEAAWHIGMAEEDEARWLRATANELNNLLQIIREAQEMLAALLPEDPIAGKFLHILDSSTKRAMEVSRTLSTRAEQRMAAFPGAVALPPTPELAVESAPPPHWEIFNPEGPGPLVLIVDDEEFILLLAQQVLADAGYRVVTARNGFQALEIYRHLHREISLVILDFMMPGLNGGQVFAELQVINPAVSVVLSSGFAEPDRLRDMLTRGLRSFLPKPYTQQKLLTEIHHTLHPEGEA